MTTWTTPTMSFLSNIKMYRHFPLNHSMLQFQQMCDETHAWINEKDQALSTEDCGRDLPSVQALQRRHQVGWMEWMGELGGLGGYSRGGISTSCFQESKCILLMPKILTFAFKYIIVLSGPGEGACTSRRAPDKAGCNGKEGGGIKPQGDQAGSGTASRDHSTVGETKGTS